MGTIPMNIISYAARKYKTISGFLLQFRQTCAHPLHRGIHSSEKRLPQGVPTAAAERLILYLCQDFVSIAQIGVELPINTVVRLILCVC